MIFVFRNRLSCRTTGPLMGLDVIKLKNAQLSFSIIPQVDFLEQYNQPPVLDLVKHKA